MASVLAEPTLDLDATRPAAWLEPLPLARRFLAFAWRFAVGLGLSGWLASAQLANNVRGPEWFWTLGIFTFAVVMAVRAFRKRDVRMYDTTLIQYTMRQRLIRSGKWFVPGIGLIGFIWWMQMLEDRFNEYWWYAWPALPLVLVGVGLFLLRSERVLSGLGQHARAEDEAAKAMRRQELGSVFDRLMNARPLRWSIAAACFYGSYSWAFESNDRRSGLAAVAAFVLGLVFAREIGLWVLGLGAWLIGLAILIGIGAALFAGIAALPVSVAVIIGAFIIAGAVGKK
jgi:hypothetical protein